MGLEGSLIKIVELEQKKSFEVSLFIDDELICTAEGKNIKTAEQSASKKAIKILKIIKQ